MISKTKIFLLFFFLLIIQTRSFSQELEFRDSQEGILLMENNQPRFFYQTATKAKNGLFPRANYIHPLYGLNGEILTEDFPDDHLHHRGIFWSWHQLYAQGKRIADPWLCEGISWDVISTSTQAKDNKAELRAEILWIETAEKTPVIKENLLVSYKRINEGAYALTFEIKLTALLEGVAIGGSEDAKGYGGFSPRFRLPEDIVFLSYTGETEPQNLPVQTGSWVELRGRFSSSAEKPTGIVIMGDPKNLPSYKGWILRSANSMQNMAFPGKEPIDIKKGKSLKFRNQILVHRDFNKEEIGKFYDKFTEN